MALVAADERSPRRRRRARQAEPDGTRAELQKLLDEQIAVLPALSDAIGRRYFNLLEKDANWVRARSRDEP